MKLMSTLLAATALVAVMGGSAMAKQLVFCSEASPAHFDPGPTTGGNDFDASSRTIYDRLVEFEHGGTAVIPGLAESWEVSEDGLTYTFKLRAGVKFHTTPYFTPTRDLNADDVIFSIERQWKQDNPWYQYLEGLSWDYFQGMDMPKFIASIEKVDDLTVKMTLTEPNAPMIANLGMDFASIVSKEYADQLAASGNLADFANKPVGTGAFVFVDYQTDAVIRYQAFADYWRGKVAIDDLIFAITTDPAVRAQKLKAGECDIMSYPAPADIAGLQADPNLTVMEQEGLNIGYLSYNTTIAPMDNVKVRKALTMAINKPAIIEAVYEGAGQDAKNLIPPTMWSYDDSIPADVYDPEGAKKLLAESSYGGPERLPKLLFVGVSGPAIEAAAQYIAEQWRQNLGITAVDMKPQQDAYAGPDQNAVQIFRDDVGTRVPDAASYLAGSIASTSSNAQNKLGGYKNDKVDSLLAEAATKAADDPERVALAQEAQKAFREDWAFIPWYAQTMSRWATKEVKGIDKNLDWQVIAPWEISIG